MSLNLTYERKHKDVVFLDGHNIQCMPHLHRELELICLLEGEVVAYADSVRCDLHPGDLFLTFPNQIHSYEKLTYETHTGIIFKPDLLPELMETFTMGIPASAVIRGGADDPQIKSLIDALMKTRDRDGFAHLSELRRGYLLALCAELLPRMSITKLQAGDSETLRTIVSFCTQNFAENLSLSLLEEKLHLNRFYISHLFSGRLGIRFNDYINSLRISEACRYLINSDYSVTEIGAMVGFNTLRTFNRAFIRQMGVSPTEYRKQKLVDLQPHLRAIAEQAEQYRATSTPTLAECADPDCFDCGDGCEYDPCDASGQSAGTNALDNACDPYDGCEYPGAEDCTF